jgi:hypothetical protein
VNYTRVMIKSSLEMTFLLKITKAKKYVDLRYFARDF